MLPESLCIYHLAERGGAGESGLPYAPESFEREGFVHCSRWSQLGGVARSLFADRDDLIVLEIDASRLGAEVRYEDLYGGGVAFPHVYGPVPRSAIVGALGVAWPQPGEPKFSRLGLDASPDSLVVRRSTGRDTDTIARMAHQLREDQGYTDAKGVGELKNRLLRWLADGCEGWVLELPASGRMTADDRLWWEPGGPEAGGLVPVGYVVVDPTRDPLCIRELFVRPGLRRAGLGTEAVGELLEHDGTTRVDVEAPSSNEAAVRFWHKLGFEDRTRGMRRSASGADASTRSPTGEQSTYAVIAGGTREAEAFILEGLKAYNDAHSPYHRLAREPGGSAPLAVMLVDEHGRWVGGICGSVHWGWLHVEDLWVAEPYRGRGHGRGLLLELERQAAARGATRSQLSTFHFQARGMYEKLGYRVVGEMTDLPPGGAFYWMRKDGLG